MDERVNLIRKIYENGKKVMQKICEMEPNKEIANHSITDCVIGTSNTHLALQIAKSKGEYPKEVIEYLENQASQERWHCSLKINGENKGGKEYDFKVALKHRYILQNYGIYVWMGVMQLLGEKVSLAKALCWRMMDDPHFVNKQATIDEYYHTTYPLLLLYAYAPIEDLRKIVELQKDYINTIFNFNQEPSHEK